MPTRRFHGELAVLVAMTLAGYSPCDGAPPATTKTDRIVIVESSATGDVVLVAGETRELRLKVRNAGSGTIDIARVLLTNCGCSGPTISQKKLAPGDTSVVTYKLGTNGLALGRYAVRLTVVKPDGEIVPVEGEVAYTIERKVLISPSALALGTMPLSQPFSKTISVRFQGEHRPTDVTATASMPDTVCSVRPAPMENADARQNGDERRPHGYQITLSGKTRAVPGEMRESVFITLLNYRGQDRMFEIPVTAHVPTEVEASPNPWLMGCVSREQVVVQRLALTHKPDAPLEVTGVGCPAWMSARYSTFTAAPGRTSVDLSITIADAPTSSGGTAVLRLTGVVGKTPFSIDIVAIFVAAPSRDAKAAGSAAGSPTR